MVRLHDDDVNANPGFGTSSMTGNRSTPMSPLSIGGGGASNFPGSADGEVFTRPPLSDPTRDAAAANPNALQAAAAGAAQLENALQDPFMARVALCGIITLYKEVKPDPVVQTPVAAPAAAPAVAAPAEEPDPAKPAAESTTPETTPSDDKAPADNKTPPEDKGNEKPAEAKPADPAAPAEANPPKKPEGAEAAPKEPAAPGK
jgi:hypothetical protein